MSDVDWNKLVERYADGRTPCNCGNAYLTYDGEAWLGDKIVTDYPRCKWGCSANQIFARNEIAAKILAELVPNPPLNNDTTHGGDNE